MSQDVIFKLRREENCEHNIILTENMQNTRMWLKKKILIFLLVFQVFTLNINVMVILITATSWPHLCPKVNSDGSMPGTPSSFIAITTMVSLDMESC